MGKKANRNRTAGHSLERDIVKRLKELGWDAATSRYVSRYLDDSGVDIAGDYPYKIQCKATVKTPNVKDLTETTAADVVFWRKMEKKGDRFYASGEYALIDLESFLNLVQKAYKT